MTRPAGIGPDGIGPHLARTASVRTVRDQLARAGIEGAAREARLLALGALSITPVDLALRGERPLGAAAASRLSAALGRRLAGEPVARILREWEFWGLRFLLTPETLVPRPDSEAVIRAALDTVPDDGTTRRFLDLGTGSGCLLVALLAERPLARGVGVDRDPRAAAAARGNAALNGVANRASFLAGDWAEALTGPFDLVVANPPYIPAGAIAGLQREVREHDPLAALDGGEDGLAAYRAILARVSRLLSADAALVLELGAGQALAVQAVAAAAGLATGRLVPDLGGCPRALVLRQKALVVGTGSL